MEFLVEGFLALTWKHVVMYVIGIVLIWLAIKKDYEPSCFSPWALGQFL